MPKRLIARYYLVDLGGRLEFVRDKNGGSRARADVTKLIDIKKLSDLTYEDLFIYECTIDRKSGESRYICRGDAITISIDSGELRIYSADRIRERVVEDIVSKINELIEVGMRTRINTTFI